MDLRQFIPKKLLRDLLVPIVIIGLMWSLEVWDWLLTLLLAQDGQTHSFLDGFGIRPRQVSGLPGIFLAPFLHRDFGHLSGNTFPLLGLSLILAFTGLHRFLAATLLIILATGSAVWLFARGGDAIHLGASGVVFGYLGFLLVKGFIEKRARWILVSLAIAFLYGGILYHNLLPTQEHVSFESHIFGLLSGILASYLLAERPTDRPRVPEAKRARPPLK